MSDGPWSLAEPRLRKDWDSLLEHRVGHGRVTAEEALWVVIITMGIAGMRAGILEDHDVEWYVLHFFVFWGALASSITYSARFNDHDLWHSVLWGLVTISLLFQIAFLYHNLTGFAGAACALHTALSLAYVRVAAWLPRARVHCGYHALLNAAIAVLFAAVAANPPKLGLERGLLWLNVFMEPVGATLFKIGVAFLNRKGDGRGTACDVPGDFAYVLGRHEGSHMMVIVCSFLFPIALQGQAFETNAEAAALVVLGNVFALLLKLSIHDLDAVASSGQDSLRHPLRRSRLHSRCFLLLFPLSMLGIALTGVGFVAAILDAAGSSPNPAADNTDFYRRLLSLGSALTCTVLTLNKLLTRHRELRVHIAKVACLVVLAPSFLLPLALGLGRLATAASSVLVQMLVLLSQIACTRLSRDPEAARGWQWETPRLLKDWAEVHRSISSHVSSNEHFFTVLLAVAIFSINATLARTHDLEQYFLHYVAVLASLMLTMRYAARFNAEDSSHKILWSVYQFIFLLQLEGLTGGSGRFSLNRSSLFKSSTVAVFLWISLAFWVRVAIALPRVRGFASYFAVVALMSAGVFAAGDFHSGATVTLSLLWAFAVISLLCDLVIVCWMRCRFKGSEERHSFDVPVNIEYVVNRFNGLYMEVIGVSVIVPNAFYPGSFAHPTLVAAGDAFAAVLAILFKICIFDAEPLTAARHAVARSQWRAVGFFTLQPVALFGICVLGASIAMLIPAAGTGGLEARDTFAQKLLCGASAMLWGSLAAMKLLHRPRKPALHIAKVMLMGAGCVSSLLLGMLGTAGDFAVLGYITLVALLVALGQISVQKMPMGQTLERPSSGYLLTT